MTEVQDTGSTAHSQSITETQSKNPSEDKKADKTRDEKPSILRRHPIAILGGVVVLIILGVVGYFLWLNYSYPYESTDDAFVDARSYSVAAKVSGYVSEVRVGDNQHVEAGTVIAKIDAKDYQIALDQANAQVEAAQAGIANSEAQISVAQASIDEARAKETSALAALKFAQDEAKRQEELQKGGAGSLQTLQQAQSNLRQSQGSYGEAQAGVMSAMKNKAAAEAQLNSSKANLRQAEAQKESAEQNLNYTTVTAAEPGRIVKLSGAKGQLLEAGQAIATFVPDDIWVTANFKETQLVYMRPGQEVNVTIDAYPDHKMRGKVDSIQPGSGTAFSLLPAENATGNYVKVTQRVPVKITVEQWPQDVSIGPGMSVLPTVTVHPDR